MRPCAECKQEISDQAITCPRCGLPLQTHNARGPFVPLAIVLAVAAIGGGLYYLASKPTRYEQVEALRAEQDKEGAHDERVRQRFFRLYKGHPHDAMYIYLWSRCLDDPSEQLKLAEEGIGADPSFSWNYNMAARALAKLGRVAEAYDRATKGSGLDPGNLELANKVRLLKVMVDEKLSEQSKPAPTAYVAYDSKENFDKGAVHYKGLVRSFVRSAERVDVAAIEANRPGEGKGPLGNAVRGFVVCANPFADACVLAYVPLDGRFKTAWAMPEIDVGTLHEDDVVSIAGAVVTNPQGETVMLVDSVQVESK